MPTLVSRTGRRLLRVLSFVPLLGGSGCTLVLGGLATASEVRSPVYGNIERDRLLSVPADVQVIVTDTMGVRFTGRYRGLWTVAGDIRSQVPRPRADAVPAGAAIQLLDSRSGGRISFIPWEAIDRVEVPRPRTGAIGFLIGAAIDIALLILVKRAPRPT